MNILILGGDKRYIEVIKNLTAKNINVDLIGYKNIYIHKLAQNICINDIQIDKYDIILFPVGGVKENNIIECTYNDKNIKLPDNILMHSKENALIISGIETINLNKILTKANRNCTYLMKDKTVIKENAIPTVEGIIADIITNTEVTINNANILIFGYGNIGSYLTEILEKLGANVTVGIIEQKDEKILNTKQINNFYTNNIKEMIKAIETNEIIVNTVPHQLLTEEYIKYLNRFTYVLDVASHPHGIDKEALDYNEIKNKIYLGIPSKVSPVTSGKILTKKINLILEGDKK